MLILYMTKSWFLWKYKNDQSADSTYKRYTFHLSASSKISYSTLPLACMVDKLPVKKIHTHTRRDGVRIRGKIFLITVRTGARPPLLY